MLEFYIHFRSDCIASGFMIVPTQQWVGYITASLHIFPIYPSHCQQIVSTNCKNPGSSRLRQFVLIKMMNSGKDDLTFERGSTAPRTFPFIKKQ
jgi:hypothetical protein